MLVVMSVSFIDLAISSILLAVMQRTHADVLVSKPMAADIV